MPNKRMALISILVIASLVAIPVAKVQSSYTPKVLFLTVYADGVVAVDYTVGVDPTRDRANVTMFGVTYQDLFVEDQDGLPLDYLQAGENLTVYTLGSTSVYISYVTPDLTSKAAKIWTLSVSTPIAADILLPANATVVSISSVPLSIGSLAGKPLMRMPPGAVEVSYIIGVSGTRENALAVIRDTELTIDALKAKGVIVSEAEAKLQQANSAFNESKYLEAEQLAEQAKTLALNVSVAASEAQEAISSASASISAAQQDGRTAGLDKADSLLLQARNSYNAGEYAGAKDLATQARTAALNATAPSPPYLWIFIGVLGAMAVSGSVLLMKRRKPPEGKSEESKGSVNLDALFQQKPDLRLEDREVLRFLAESNGEAFASEIRDRFDMPRTSAWRMMRRLQREGVVDIKSVGGQSLVSIKPKYRA